MTCLTHRPVGGGWYFAGVWVYAGRLDGDINKVSFLSFGWVFTMSLKKISLVALVVLIVGGSFVLPCQAQNTFRRQRALRWLGQGFGDGYHRQNPGYDTSYYNPYSAHNSRLISQSPEYMAINPVPTNQELPRRFFNGVPFSAYAAPPQVNSNYQASPSQQFQGSFSPSIGSGLDNDSDNSFQRSEDEAEDNDFRDDDVRDDEDNDFRDDGDNDFRDEPEAGSVERDDNENFDVEGIDDRDVDAEETDTSNLGGLSDLNDSLSFDFE